ncbi:MAG: hypothetical protein HY567_01550 [Candidatus Kerfeldbacteria bacterium]|nr:hypothetical protein [Candidatus Kerfeldbacteria bacterium]
MPQPKKVTTELRMVNIHQINGDIMIIEFLKNADFHWVEGLFLRAKQLGRTELEYHGKIYQLLKNRNLTYTVQEVPEKIAFVESL